MPLPKVAIVGRPNVGKSTLINRLLGKRQAIVDDQPGVTRDRSFQTTDWNGREFRIIDTGGVQFDPADPFFAHINEQVDLAIAEADVVVFIVDLKTGVTEGDEVVAKRLRKIDKPCILAVNKVDTVQDLGVVSEFYSLGMGDPIATSAEHGFGGVGDLLDAVVEKLPESSASTEADDEEEESIIRLTFTGRPNVGKSSLLNALLGQQRTIVSDVSGTTRDAIQERFEYRGQTFELVDTAGLRRRTKVNYGVELFSVDRAVRSMRHSDVNVVLLDAEEGLTEQDKRILQKAADAGCGLIIAVNKWDLIEQKDSNSAKRYQDKLVAEIPNLGFAPFIFISAKTGQRVTRILDQAIEVFENTQRRISTSVLNDVVQESMAISPPPTIKNKRLKVLYATQASVGPPTFVFFVNNNKLMKDAYRRFLEKQFRRRIELTGAPIRFILRQREPSTSKY